MSFGNQRNRNSSAEKLRFPTGSWVFSRAFQLAFRYRWLDESRGGMKETDGEATRSRSFLCDRFYLHLTIALLQASVKAEIRVIIMSFASGSEYGFCIYLDKMALNNVSISNTATAVHVNQCAYILQVVHCIIPSINEELFSTTFSYLNLEESYNPPCIHFPLSQMQKHYKH